MTTPRYDLSYLTDPTTFAVGRLAPVSDHDCYATTAEADAEATSLRQTLNGRWKFHYANNMEERPIGFQKPDAPLDAWDEIAVPGHIQLQGYGNPQYVNTQYPWDGHEQLRPPQIPVINPVGSYVRFFEVPREWWNGKKRRITLTFHGVETAFFCWVNGTLVGYAEDSFTPSRFDITDALTSGKNKLAVQVFRYSTASWLEDQDFWRFFGIFRDVELSVEPYAHVRDVFVHTDLDDSFTAATLRAEIALDLPSEPVTLKAALLASTGECVDSISLPAQADMVITRPIQNPLLWSAEAPNLYTLRLTLTNADGAEIEVAQTRVGFRRFELKNGLMLINGKRIVFRGVDRHEFCMEGGRVITPEDMRKDIFTLKRNNLNAVRTSHYPNHSLWYKLCDEYGIYLIDETNLETHGTWQRCGKINPEWAVPSDNPAWLPAIIDRAASMQERDKNHPSVLIWSCGNESFGGRDLYEMSEYLRKRDPGRLVHYEGIFNDRRYNDTSDMESRMYPPAAEVAQFIEQHPEKPFILCEYTHAMGNSCGGMDEYIALEDKYPQYQGGFIWDFIDQALLTTAPNGKKRLAYGGDFGDRPTDWDFCGNGILFADRTPTPKLQEVKYLYQGIRLEPDKNGVTIENRLLFTNASAYKLRWALLCDGLPMQQGHLDTLDVAPGEKRRYELPVMPPYYNAEYVLHCGLYLHEPTKWADTEYELMHGQTVIAYTHRRKPEPRRYYEIIFGDTNVGARGDGFEMLFGKIEGGVCSLRGADGHELLMTAPTLSLFRAPTNNDIGNGDNVREALWHAASLYAKGSFVAAYYDEGALHVSYRYDLPLASGATVDVLYTVIGDGKLRVDMEYHGKPNLPDMAAFGLSFRLPHELQNVHYYGLGPAENYIDRCCGACLGQFAYRVKDNLTPYLWPQECGNRERVRWLSVLNSHGHGLRVSWVVGLPSISVLPYSAAELAAARHIDELPEPTYTYLDIALSRKGIGGDDSWGAPVLPRYHIPGDEEIGFSFMLEII